MADANPSWPMRGDAPPELYAHLTPSGVYMRVDDNIRLTSYNSLTGVTISIRTRFLTLDGAIQASVDTHTPNTDRTAASSIIVTSEGWLLGCEVFASAGTPQIGQTFIVLEAVRGLVSSATPLQFFTSGYVTSKQPLAWPGVSPGQSLDGAGAIRIISGTTPAAGADISETVPTGARWELLTFQAVLTTSATVANRAPQLQLSDGTTTFFKSPGVFNTAASTASTYGWAQGTPLSAVVNGQAAPAAIAVNHRLSGGFKIVTATSAIQVGDQWSAIRYLVREWIEGN